MFERMDIDDLDMENELLEGFGDKYIADALRIVTTRITTPLDNEMMYEAMCIIVAMYMNKVNTGCINKDRTLH
jgi:hypothetical protein